MPRVNIYIRNEDWETWKAIEDKPDFLHTILQKRKMGTDLHPTTVARITDPETLVPPEESA